MTTSSPKTTREELEHALRISDTEVARLRAEVEDLKMELDNARSRQRRFDSLSDKLVLMESPFAGDEIRNVTFGRWCLRDSLLRGEAPMASHLLYTQAGVLEDRIARERQCGIEAGLAWGLAARSSIVYTDLGITEGMQRGIDRAKAQGRKVEMRKLGRVPERALT